MVKAASGSGLNLRIISASKSPGLKPPTVHPEPARYACNAGLSVSEAAWAMGRQRVPGPTDLAGPVGLTAVVSVVLSDWRQKSALRWGVLPSTIPPVG